MFGSRKAGSARKKRQELVACGSIYREEVTAGPKEKGVFDYLTIAAAPCDIFDRR